MKLGLVYYICVKVSLQTSQLPRVMVERFFQRSLEPG